MSTIVLKTLPGVVPGTDYARTLQGNTPADVAGTGFLDTDTLSATVFQGQNLPAIFTVVPTWFNSASCQFTLDIPNAQTTLLDSDAVYYGLVTATRGGTTWPIAEFYLPTLPTPLTQAAASPPDLVSIPYALRLLAQLSLTEAQFESVPTLITAASDAIRLWCKRRFDQNTVTEEIPVIQGIIRLSCPPINYIQRIQCRPDVALTVANTTADTAWVYPLTTGDVAGGQSVTGLVLNWESGGVASSSTITYANLADQQISTLAAAIAAVGSGWTATAADSYGTWPISEISDGLASKGAGPNDQPNDAEFHVYSQSITDASFLPDDGQLTGMVQLGRYGGDLGPRWGPGWEMFAADYPQSPGRVKVTYNGGFAAIPPRLQLACVEMVKHDLNRLGTDLILSSEDAADYSYQINENLLNAYPPWVKEVLSQHKINNA